MCLRKSLKCDFCGIQSEARHEFHPLIKKKDEIGLECFKLHLGEMA